MLLPNLESLSIHTESVDGLMDEHTPPDVLRRIEKFLPGKCFELLLKWRVSKEVGASATTTRLEFSMREPAWDKLKLHEVQRMVDAIENAVKELSSSGFNLLEKEVETQQAYTVGRVVIDVKVEENYKGNLFDMLTTKFFPKYCEDGRGDDKLYFLEDVSASKIKMKYQNAIAYIDMPCHFCHVGRPGSLRSLAKSLKSHEE